MNMKILYCNKFNYPFSGTESYLFELMRRVEQRGHETALFSMDHRQPSSFAGRSYLIPYKDFKDPSASFLEKARLAAHVLYSRTARRRIRECLRDYSPTVAHIRGIYHHLSPSILWELKAQHVPVLYHVNDFKLLCPSYNFVAKGRACEACIGGRFFHVLTDSCYAGPWSSAAVLASEAYLHRWLNTYERVSIFFWSLASLSEKSCWTMDFPQTASKFSPISRNCPEKIDCCQTKDMFCILEDCQRKKESPTCCEQCRSYRMFHS